MQANISQVVVYKTGMAWDAGKMESGELNKTRHISIVQDFPKPDDANVH